MLVEHENIPVQVVDQRRNKLEAAEAGYVAANAQRDQAEAAIKAAEADVERLQTGEEKKERQSRKYKKVCTTDPDATMATNARNRRLEPAYKQHTAVDDKVGVILDVAVTTGQTNEGEMIEPQVDQIKGRGDRIHKHATSLWRRYAHPPEPA